MAYQHTSTSEYVKLLCVARGELYTWVAFQNLQDPGETARLYDLDRSIRNFEPVKGYPELRSYELVD